MAHRFEIIGGKADGATYNLDPAAFADMPEGHAPVAFMIGIPVPIWDWRDDGTGLIRAIDIEHAYDTLVAHRGTIAEFIRQRAAMEET